jgi:glycopeptide antibiotics resistance protein
VAWPPDLRSRARSLRIVVPGGTVAAATNDAAGVPGLVSLVREFRYPISLLFVGLVVVAAVWVVVAAIRARSMGAGPAIRISLAEATLAAGILVIWALTLAPLLPSGRLGPGPTPPVNLVPILPLIDGLLAPDRGSYLVDYLGNVALFVPFGVGLAWRFGISWRRVGLIALVTSGAIETWQAVAAQQRNGDVNDVLLNTTGALIGAWVVTRTLGRRRALSGPPRPPG